MQTKISRGLCCLLFLFLFGLASVPYLSAQYQQTHKFLTETAGFSVSSIQGTDDYLWAGTYFYGTGTDLSDLLIFRTDANGDIVWSKLIDVSDDDRCTHVQEYPSGAVFTGYAINVDGTRTLLIGTISHSGTVGFIETYEDVLTGRHAEGLHITYTEADATPGFAAVGMVDGGYNITDPKSVLLVRVDDGGQFMFSQRYDSPLVVGSTEDYDMGAYVLDMPLVDGFFITGSANMPSGGTTPTGGTLALMVDNQTGAIDWVNNYATLPASPSDREPGAATVWDATGHRLLNLANSTDHHGFTLTELDPVTGATPGNTRQYNTIPFNNCLSHSNSPAFTMAIDQNGDLAVAGHIPGFTLPNFGFGSTPPYLCKIDLTTMVAIAGEQHMYLIPTTLAAWASFGGFYAPFPTLSPNLTFIYTPEFMLPATNGQGYIIATQRDEMGANEFDVEVLLTQGNTEGVCDDEELCFDAAGVNLRRETTMTANNGVAQVAPQYNDDDQESFTVDCDCQATWPKLGLGTRFYGNDIHVDTYREYVGGHYVPTSSIDAYTLSPSQPGTTGITVVLDRCGNILWLEDWDNTTSSSNNGVEGICADLEGNVYATGSFNGNIDIQGNSLTSSNDDGLLVSYDRFGNLRWFRQLGGSANGRATAVQTDANGNVYVAGFFKSQLTHGGSTPLVSGGGWDGFIISYDDAGAFRWALRLGGNGDDYIYDLAESGGEVYPVGTFTGTASLPQTTGGTATITSNGGDDWFWVEYDANGLRGAAVSGGGSQGDYAVGIDAAAGNVVIAGMQFSGNMTIGLTTYTYTTQGSGDLFAACFTTAGVFSWLGNGGGSGIDEAQSVAINPANDEVYLIGGSYSNPGTFGSLSTSTNSNSQDILHIQMDLTPATTNGGFTWANTYGDVSADLGLALDYTPQADPNFRGVFNTGIFRVSLTMGGTITGSGSSPDMFISRTYSNGTSFKSGGEIEFGETILETKANRLLAYPNPMQDQLHIAVDEEGAGIRAVGVVDGRGVIVKAQKVNSLHSVLLEDLQLSAGIHTVFVELEDGKRLYTRVSVLR